MAGDVMNEKEIRVKIRPFRYGNANSEALINLTLSMLKSDRFGMEIQLNLPTHLKNHYIVKIRPFRYGNKIAYCKSSLATLVKIRPFRYGNYLAQN